MNNVVCKSSEIDDYVFCKDCEEAFHCVDADKRDGCEWGLKSSEDKTECIAVKNTV